MLFPTAEFAVFFAVVLVLGWGMNRRRTAWKVVMLLASYYFYAFWNWKLLPLIVGSTLLNHVCSVLVRPDEGRSHRRAWLVFAMAANLAVLGVFKYYRFFASSLRDVCLAAGWTVSPPVLNLILPVGISFITFQAMSLVIDTYRGDLRERPSLLDTGVFIAFFPQLVAGPILRGRDFMPQILHPSSGEAVDVGRAVCLILGGLFKKIVVANSLAALLVDPVFSEPELHGGLSAWLAVYGYAMQIYCDFSAYSDIAIGVALLMGLRFNLNFDAPYLSVDLKDFWRRWHISLSSWLRDYLYIPLGGSRRGESRTLRNLLVTFLLGGLWHGAAWTFIAWGATHGVWLCLERMFLRRHQAALNGRGWRLLRGFITFHVVCLSWLFFRSETFGDAWLMLRGLFSRGTDDGLVTVSVVVIVLVGFFSQLADGARPRRIWDGFNRLHWAFQGTVAALVLTCILALGPRGVAPFIYFQF